MLKVTYRNLDYDESKLPPRTYGPKATHLGERVQRVRRFHGTKMEAMYSVLSDWTDRKRGLRASGDRNAGERYNGQARGVYCHDLCDWEKIASYTRWCPIFNDGTYVRTYFEIACDEGLAGGMFLQFLRPKMLDNGTGLTL